MNYKSVIQRYVCVSTMLMYHSYSDGTDKMHTLNARTYKTLFTNPVKYLSEMVHTESRSIYIKNSSNITITNTVTQAKVFL